MKNKFDFLRKEIPLIDPDKFIFITHKNIIPFSIKMDDKAENLEGGSIKLLFDSYHNQNYNEEE